MTRGQEARLVWRTAWREARMWHADPKAFRRPLAHHRAPSWHQEIFWQSIACAIYRSMDRKGMYASVCAKRIELQRQFGGTGKRHVWEHSITEREKRIRTRIAFGPRWRRWEPIRPWPWRSVQV